MIQFQTIPRLNNFIKDSFVKQKGAPTVFSKPIELYSDKFLQSFFDTVIMIEFIDNFRNDSNFIFLFHNGGD